MSLWAAWRRPLSLHLSCGFLRQTEDNSNNEKVKKQRDDDGVSKTLAALGRYASLHDFTLITPAKVQSGDKATDLDALLVTYAGVVGIKCIGYNGQIYAQTPATPPGCALRANSAPSLQTPLTSAPPMCGCCAMCWQTPNSAL